MHCIAGIRFDENRNCLDAIRPSEQADALADYFDQEDSVYHMLVGLVECRPEHEQNLASFVAALQQAIRSDLTKAGAAVVPRELALANLGRQLLNHAHRYAQEQIDNHIDDNWSELVWESNQPADI